MKKTALLLWFGFCLPLILSAADPHPMLMWYDAPAESFEQALPLGNGRLGIMVYGGIRKETFNINEETLWGGGPADNNPNPESPAYLGPVRDELFAGNWQEAGRLVRKMQGPNVNSYAPFADLHMEQDIEGDAEDYIRTLDLNTAVATSSFTAGGVKYEREVFVSAPAQVIVMRLTASEPGKLGFSLSADTQYEGWKTVKVSGNEFVLNGQLPFNIDTDGNIPLVMESEDGRKGMRYQLRVRAVSADGRGTINYEDGLKVSGATDVTLYISAATSFNGYLNRPDTEGKDEDKISRDHLQKAVSSPYDKLKTDHINDYRSYFDRLSLYLGTNPEAEKLPTDKRLTQYKEGTYDPALEALYLQFGRYLLISCSRPGGIPANLQGIWNHRQRPPWGSDYTTNINVEMNYWPAAMLNLPETELPLIDHIGRWAVNGREIVKNYYNMQGWTIHHNSDIWAVANPVQGSPTWSNWPMGGPWVCQHLFWHYEFTMDRDYLAGTAYPLMKEAALFCDDWLILKDGHYITAPSTSPENLFIDDNGNRGEVNIASAMDIQIIWDLYNNLIRASSILGTDEGLREKWTEKRDNLFPLQIGSEGNLMEWYRDWKDLDPQHRHVSHLFGLHPGRQISPLTTPELAGAAKRTLEIRGDGGTGWSKAWKVNFWARLLDGDHSYKMYRELLSNSTLPNLFDTHPPFQIDGNFGGASGVGEMLMQSHMGELHLLPAIPSAWKEGNIKGMLGRGGYTVDIEWKNNSLHRARVTAKTVNECTVRTNVPITIEGAEYQTVGDGEYYLTSFRTDEGKTYEITAAEL